MSEMIFVDRVLSNIEFEDKFPNEKEAFGIYRVPVTVSGCLEFVKLYPKSPYEPHIHDRCSAQFVFLKGSGTLLLDDQKFPYSKGSIFNVPAGVLHGFVIDEETIFLSIQSNPIQDRTTGEIDIRYK